MNEPNENRISTDSREHEHNDFGKKVVIAITEFGKIQLNRRSWGCPQKRLGKWIVFAPASAYLSSLQLH